MKPLPLLVFALLVACTPTTTPSGAHTMDMDTMPCHQMANGEWMGDCAEQATENAESPPAQSMSILTVKDSDDITITADEVTKTINDTPVTMYAYNGMIPGVALRVHKDATITVNFDNNLPFNTTIHWHGLRHDIKDDGVPDISQAPVEPGETYQYTVSFPDEGIYWYHPHVDDYLQQDLGLAGIMLVDPIAAEYYNPVNYEELLVLDDLLMNENGLVPFTDEYATYALMGRYGNVLLVNGQTDYELAVDKGSVVRFYVSNVANARPFKLAFEGLQMKLIGADLSKYERETLVDDVILAPGERAIVEVAFPQSGSYRILNQNPLKTRTLGTIQVSDTAAASSYMDSFSTLRENTDVSDDIDRFRKHFFKDPEYEIDLTVDMDLNEHMAEMPCHEMPNGQMMGDCDEPESHNEITGMAHLSDGLIEWEDTMPMMNAMSTSHNTRWILADANSDKQNMNLDISANIGDVVKIRFHNRDDSAHPMQHPVHLHGQRFLIVERNDNPQDNLAWKDTVLVPVGETADILVDVTNPGEWMMHCHISEHIEAGMMTTLTAT